MTASRVLRALCVVALLCATVTAFAAEDAGHGEHHGIDVKTLVLQVLNFGVLLFVLIKFGGGAVNKALQARHEQLKADLQEAARVRAVAEQRAKDQEKRLANIEAEIAAMLASMRTDADGERARIVAAAEDRARRIQDETRFQLDQQVKEAELRFRAEVARAAVKAAQALLERSVGPGDEQRLAQSFVAELGARPGTGHADGTKPAPRLTAGLPSPEEGTA